MTCDSLFYESPACPCLTAATFITLLSQRARMGLGSCCLCYHFLLCSVIRTIEVKGKPE